MLFRNLGEQPHIKFESVVTGEIEYVNQCHSGAEEARGPLHVGGHRSTGRREVHREEDVFNQAANHMGPTLTRQRG